MTSWRIRRDEVEEMLTMCAGATAGASSATLTGLTPPSSTCAETRRRRDGPVHAARQPLTPEEPGAVALCRSVVAGLPRQRKVLRVCRGRIVPSASAVFFRRPGFDDECRSTLSTRTRRASKSWSTQAAGRWSWATASLSNRLFERRSWRNKIGELTVKLYSRHRLDFDKARAVARRRW